MGNTPIDISSGLRNMPVGLGSEELDSRAPSRLAATVVSEPGSTPPRDSYTLGTDTLPQLSSYRSLLLRTAESFHAETSSEETGLGFFGFSAGADPQSVARAYFRDFQLFREPGSLEPQLLSQTETDAETLEEALRHFEALYGETGEGSLAGDSPCDPATILRLLARSVAAQNPGQPDAAQRLANERLICRAYAALLRVEGRNSDRNELIVVWLRWCETLAQYPLGAETLIQDYAELSAILLRNDLHELRSLLSDTIEAQVDAWRRPAAGTEARAGIQGRQRAFSLLQETWQGLGDTGRELFLDLVDDLERDALSLEREAATAEPAARLQILGEVAALYRQLADHPEAGEHYRSRLRGTLDSLLEVGREATVDPGLRLQVAFQVAREFEADGEATRAEAIRAELSARAERALIHGRRSNASILDRYADLREALLIRRELGPEADREAAEGALRTLLQGVLETVRQRENPELRREAAAFALEAYLELGDWDSAETLWRGLFEGLPRPEAECREGAAEPPLDVDTCAAWLQRLGSYAQRLAVARADGAEAAPDFSLFREALSDLAALGARHGRRTMALYGRFMQAILDRDPAAETIYEQLQGAGSPVENGFELPIHGILLAASGEETPPAEAEPDEYQRMAREIWERQRAFMTLDRCMPTLGFLSQLIEGNYQQRLAAANEAGDLRTPILEEREAMRRSLVLIQQALVEGRTSTTAEAIELLPDLLGDERAARDFHRGLGGAFAYESLDGIEHGSTDLARRLIDVELSANPELRAQRYLSLARQMVVADSLNRRCDGLIAALLQAAEDSGARGRAPRPLLEILGNLSRDSRDLGDFSELYNRIAGNETLQEQIQAFRDVTPYIWTMNQVVDSVFSVEGGAILLASIFTGGVAAELAGAALLARLGATAYVVADGAVAMTWSARAAVGATRIAAAWAARSATELGGIAAYRAAMGRRQMDLEELRLRLITSLFCSVGDEFATHFTRAFLGRALRSVFGETARGMARTHAVTEVGEFFASGLGEMWGEDVGARVAGQAPDTRPFLARYFEETLHGSFFVAGTRVGAPLSEAVLARVQPTEFSAPDSSAVSSVPSISWSLERLAGFGTTFGFLQALHPIPHLRVGQDVTLLPAIEGSSGRDEGEASLSGIRGRRGGGGGMGTVAALLAAGAGAATLLGANTAHAAFEASGPDGSLGTLSLALGAATLGGFWLTRKIRAWRSRAASESQQSDDVSTYREMSPAGVEIPRPAVSWMVARRLDMLRSLWADRELNFYTRQDAFEAYEGRLRQISTDQREFFAEQAALIRRHLDGFDDHPSFLSWYQGLHRFYYDRAPIGKHVESELSSQMINLYEWLLLRLPKGHPEIYQGAELLFDLPDEVRDIRLLRRLMKQGFRASDREAMDFVQQVLETSRDSGESPLMQEDAAFLYRQARHFNLAEPLGESRDLTGSTIKVRVAPEIAPPESLEATDAEDDESRLETPIRDARNRGRGGPEGPAILLAAGSGIATFFGTEVARAQESGALLDGSAVDLASLLVLGGTFAAGMAYLYASWRRSSGRLHLWRIAELSDPGSPEAERREARDWLRREARDNAGVFGVEAVRALRNDIRNGSLPALDVYMALLETDHPTARQLLTAADVRRCEAMILAQVRGTEGVERLTEATLRARISARLIDVLAQRINHPFVSQQLMWGVMTGHLRPTLVLLKALEEAHPDRLETLEDMFTVLRRAARNNYQARRFLERVLGRADLARFHDQARFEVEAAGRGS